MGKAHRKKERLPSKSIAHENNDLATISRSSLQGGYLRLAIFFIGKVSCLSSCQCSCAEATLDPRS
jgi:hypothetical protein